MDSELLFKVSTLEDCQKVSELANIIWHECYKDVITNEQIDYMVNKFLAKDYILSSINEGTEFYLVIDEIKPIGFISFKKEDKKMYLSKFYILKDKRHLGFGKNIINLLINECKKDKLSSIYLNVNKNNPTIEIYKKLGFKKVKKSVTDIGNGFVMDDYIMELKVC